MPYWDATKARQAGWRSPKRVSSFFSGWAWVSMAWIME
jgi:hypothetical protein